MGNSYWSRTYGGFVKPTPKGPEALHGKERDEFVKKWKEMQKLFEPYMSCKSGRSGDVRN